MDKKKQAFKESFKSSKVKYGGYATIVTIVVVILLMGLNLLVDQIPGSLDLTQNRMFSLSQQTYDVLDDLEQDVRIIGLYAAGADSTQIGGILQKYADYSPYVTLSYVDPVKNPAFAQKYGDDIAANDYIVETDNTYRVVKYNDLFNYTMNQQTYQQQLDSLAVEENITSAIQYVASGSLPKMYMIQGHGEVAMNGNVKSKVDISNYQMEDLTLATQEAIPDDADIVVINGAQSDISEYEADLLRDYLENEGSLAVFLDVYAKDLPNLDGLLRSYGVAMQDCFVIETDPAHIGSNTPVYLWPVIKSHEITDPIIKSGYQIGIYLAKGIEVLDQRRDTLTVEPLLMTSQDAYGETDYENIESLDNLAPPTADDIPGPINLAVAVTDTWYTDNAAHSAHLLVGSSTQIIQTISFGGYTTLAPQPGNVDFFMNTLAWMTGNQSGISIRPVDLKLSPLPLTRSQVFVYAFIAVILIPLAALGAGIYVWLKRRHL